MPIELIEVVRYSLSSQRPSRVDTSRYGNERSNYFAYSYYWLSYSILHILLLCNQCSYTDVNAN